jgi:hypothetical protein
MAWISFVRIDVMGADDYSIVMDVSMATISVHLDS